MYPDFADNVKKFYIMGGNCNGNYYFIYKLNFRFFNNIYMIHKFINFLLAVGNTTPQAEFNFYADPESAHIVLCSSNKLRLLPWETCLKSKVSNVSIPI